jgi:predicted Zn finger-like uncharacterized protein
MPEVILDCPQCQRQLRVTEDLVGRPVKCPACLLTFTVPAQASPPQAALPATAPPEGTPGMPPEPRPESLAPRPPYPPAESQPGYRGGYEPESRPRSGRPAPWDLEPQAGSRVNILLMPPAICLIVAGVLGMLVDLANLAIFVAAPEKTKHDMQVRQEEMHKQFNLGGEIPPPDMVFGIGIAMHAGFAVLSLVCVVGAIQMLRRRMYGLAMLGAVLPIINCDNGCCCLGLPLGIWAFIMLLRPEVKDAFT